MFVDPWHWFMAIGLRANQDSNYTEAITFVPFDLAMLPHNNKAL